MKYKIEEIVHEKDGKQLLELELTFENGKKWLLVPLTPRQSIASRAYFYQLLKRQPK